MIEERKHPRYKARILIKYKRLDDPISSWQIEPEVKNIIGLHKIRSFKDLG